MTGSRQYLFTVASEIEVNDNQSVPVSSHSAFRGAKSLSCENP